MKFTMYEKETKDSKYRDNLYRACNFAIDHEGYMICPNGKRFYFLKTAPVKGNQFGRTEEYYQCEDCEGCPHREKCHKSKENRIVRVNEELTRFHNEVLSSLNCVHGALLRMNRSIQAEGAFGGIKWNKGYKRLRRRGIEGVILELGLISCGFNLYKYHLRKLTMAKSGVKSLKYIEKNPQEIHNFLEVWLVRSLFSQKVFHRQNAQKMPTEDPISGILRFSQGVSLQPHQCLIFEFKFKATQTFFDLLLVIIICIGCLFKITGRTHTKFKVRVYCSIVIF